MSLEKDQIFFKNFSIVVAILALMMVVFLVAANLVGDVNYGGDARQEQISARTAPMGEVRVDGEAMPEEMAVAGTDNSSVASAEPKSGKAVYESVCIACHSGAMQGVPALGDASAWAPRIDKGKDTLYKHAINGFQGDAGMMPAKGGNSALSDAEVKAAVDYILENSQS